MFIRVVYLVIIILCCTLNNYSQFARAGVIETGGDISFSSTKTVFDGETVGNSVNIFSFSPYFGYFITDGFELGFKPTISSISSGGGSTTTVFFFAAPAYNFVTSGNLYPYIEGLLGYTSQSNGTTRNGLSYGLAGGLKIGVGGRALVNTSIQYVAYTLDRDQTPGRDGFNQLWLGAGFRVWFN
jgi:hypothetical protein